MKKFTFIGSRVLATLVACFFFVSIIQAQSCEPRIIEHNGDIYSFPNIFTNSNSPEIGTFKDFNGNLVRTGESYLLSQMTKNGSVFVHTETDTLADGNKFFAIGCDTLILNYIEIDVNEILKVYYAPDEGTNIQTKNINCVSVISE